MTPFGTTKTGKDVQKITLRAGQLTVSLLTLGAILHDVRLDGVDRSLTTGSDHLADYEGPKRHHGSLIGPIANRISTARIRIDGIMHELERNQDGRIHRHSGAQGTHLQVWTVAAVSDDSATLTLHLPDGMCGLPGDRHITARFTVTAPATLTMVVTGHSDEKTPMNFANHSYWNLDGSASWAGHQLRIDADRYLPTTTDVCPTGDIDDVAGTDMDFRTTRIIQPNAPAFDTNFCLTNGENAVTLTGKTGVQMTMETTAPGVQIYDGRDQYHALAIEAQGWPDAPNNPNFPSIMISPDQPYHQTTRWSFKS